jgi:hypothetical protein
MNAQPYKDDEDRGLGSVGFHAPEYGVDCERVEAEAVAPESNWLIRPKTIKLLWWVFSVILAITVFAQIFVHAFFAIYGFVSCLGMVLFAKLLGVFLKRPDTYYYYDDHL